MAVDVDANIVDLFGPLPEGIDLEENYADTTDMANIALIAIALLSVILRFGARAVQKAGFKADDYLVIVALLLSIATCVLAGETVDAGAGKHVWTLTTDQVVNLTKILYILAMVYAPAVWALKASIIFLYIRLFPLNDNMFRIGIYSVSIITTAMCISSVAILLAACRPVSFFWDRFEANSTGQCLNINSMFIAFASINVFLDFLLLAIPIPRILKLQMTTKKKIIVIASLFLGIFVCVAGLMRIYYLVLLKESRDYSFRLAPVCMWLAMEPAIGIVTTCLPNMLPLYYWCCERVGIIREGNETRHHISSGNRSKIYGDGQRLPTYIENNMVLRPKEDDEICLTTMATAARNVSNESVEVLGNGIMVRSEVTQTIEPLDSAGLRRVTSL